MKKSVLFLLMLMAGTFSFAQSKRELVRERVDNVLRKNYEKGNFDTLYMTRPDSKLTHSEAERQCFWLLYKWKKHCGW